MTLKDRLNNLYLDWWNYNFYLYSFWITFNLTDEMTIFLYALILKIFLFLGEAILSASLFDNITMTKFENIIMTKFDNITMTKFGNINMTKFDLAILL